MEFIRENVTSDATLEDVEQYAEVLESLARGIGKSNLWEEGNIPSLMAVVAWSFLNDVDLDNWIVDYCNRNHTYADNQTENFRQMRENLEQFIKQTEAA